MAHNRRHFGNSALSDANRQVYCRFLVVLMCLPSCPDYARAQIPDLQKAFFNEYPAAVDRLRSRLRNVTVKFKSTDDFESYGGEILVRDQSRLLTRRVNTRPYEDVHCWTPDTFFVLRRHSESEPFSVVVAKRHAEESANLSVESWIDRVLYSMWLPNTLTVESVMRAKSFAVKTIRSRDLMNQRLVEVVYTHDEPTTCIGSGRWVFAPALDWALTEWEVTIIPKRPGTGFTESNLQKQQVRLKKWGDITFPERIEWTSYFASKPKPKAPMWVAEISEVIPGEIPRSGFTPSAFGISDAIVARPVPLRPGGNWWLPGISIAGLVVSLVWIFLLWRRSRSTATA